MNKIMVAGCGTDVGKTIVSAILTLLLGGDYWKPIQCGGEEHSDPILMRTLLDSKNHHVHESAYSLKACLSPHHAARLEGLSIEWESIRPPSTQRPLIIEGVGGLFVPLTTRVLSIDLFKLWDCRWVVVSQHYLGSINHTLLTLQALKQQGISVEGLIFNGEPNPDSEAAILEISQLPCLGRLLPEKEINSLTIQKYAKQWQPQLSRLAH